MEKVKEAKCVVKVGGNTNMDARELYFFKNRSPSDEVTGSASKRCLLEPEITTCEKYCCNHYIINTFTVHFLSTKV